MSDSGSESSSSEGYNGHRGRATTPDESPSRFASNSDRKTPDSYVSSRGKSPPGSPPASPNSSRPASPKSPSEPASPRSRDSSPKSRSPSPKSYRSAVNSLESPRSDRSSPQSPVRGAGSYHSGPSSPKSTKGGGRASPKSYTSGPMSPASREEHTPKSYRNSESRQSSPKSPGSGRSSPKSMLSGRSSQKSYKSGRGSLSVEKHDKRSSPRSPPARSNSFNELDGEQISDGDIEDELESAQRTKPTPMTHGEDLSDVSDLDSLDGVDETEANRGASSPEPDRPKKSIPSPEPAKVEKEEKIVPVGLTDETEQLDFEAEGQWKDEREEGETEPPPMRDSKDLKDNDNNDNDKDREKLKTIESGEIPDEKEEGEEDGEKVESELEEGELSDGEDARPEETEPRPVCRFYNRGQCTWGVSCRFLHPGVTDKGNYTMFDMVRPMAYPPHASGTHEFRPHIERPALVRPLSGYPAHPHPPKVEELPAESAWERGLRHAKEMMRKANKRKESDMDFEEKKMNLSLGQDELEREAGYYVRAASPEPPVERWPPREVSRRPPPPRVTPERYVEDPEAYYPPAAPPEYYSARERRVQYKPEPRPGPEYRERLDYHPVPRNVAPHSVSPPPHPRDRERDRERERERDYYEKYEKKHKRPSREVIVERIPPTKPWREEEPPPVERGRGDEWADPWMRRKSPTAVRRNATSSRRSRRQSYSSGSSYSTSSSSRSSSRSSYTSYDSLSRSRSPTPSSRPRTSSKGKPPSSPPPPSQSATAPPSQRGAMLMNPPAPSPRHPKGSISPTSGTLHRRAGLNPPAPSPMNSQRHHDKTRDKAALAAAAVAKVIKSRSRSRSSHSSSGSESSGSSSDSSESSYSSSSVETRRRKGASPTISRKDTKGIEPPKNSGTKQQIKVTLKSSSSNPPPVKKVDRGATIAGKKRPLESPPPESKASVAAAAAKAAKKATSRREELLKQLKAVEDAIARKRSKMLMPKKNRVTIYEYLFKEGVMVAKKDYHAPKHPATELETIPNLQVIKAMQSLKSRGYVKEQFAWRHFYWYLTNDGIEYLRGYLHLPPEIVPSTLKRQPRPETARPRPAAGSKSEGSRPAEDRAGYRRGPGGPPAQGDKKADIGPGTGDLEFRGGFGRGKAPQ